MYVHVAYILFIVALVVRLLRKESDLKKSKTDFEELSELLEIERTRYLKIIDEVLDWERCPNQWCCCGVEYSEGEENPCKICEGKGRVKSSKKPTADE